ncbi:MAG: amylo-alpha-1,6-glucosidase [Desulfobacterales bacterium]|jgi:hypothetical protein
MVPSPAPEDPNYHPVFSANVFQHDSTDHQETAWSWLIGPLLTALIRFHGSDGKAKARKFTGLT